MTVAAIIFIFGLIIGSFLNVCILRIPAAESIVLPSSHCPKCGAAIKPYDNIPVVSWFVLAGRCRKCKARISPMYPMVELATGLLFVACYFAFGFSAEAVKWAVFAALLVVLTVTDLRERILPDKVNFVGLGLGLLLSLFTQPTDGTATWLANHFFAYPPPEPALSFADALIGAGAASGLLWLVAEGYFRARGREGMGLGDVKMMAMAGAFLGLQRALLTILLGSLLGSVIGAVVISVGRKGRDFELPFGTFLGAGAILVVFFGSAAIGWYRAFAHV
ncbi:MAG TPA: prepilin peptidase [Candidatus Acidoferrales bacterium]|nr:prepilin peptidase [Candidatus Acidoferrales bacterium]